MVSKKSTQKSRPRAKEKSCDRAIKKTLTYRSIFNYPMSRYQLYTFLITKKYFDERFFRKSLRRLVKKDHIKAKDGKYYLPSVRPVSWKLRDKYSRDLLDETEKIVKMLRVIPWIKMLAVSGSVAVNNAVKDDDIDIFIITQKKRLYLTRFFTFLILKIVNKYAQGKEQKRKLCCNLFVDETNIKWQKNKQNLYIAHEVLNLHPLIVRDEMYFKFLKENFWAQKYFKNWQITLPQRFSPAKDSQSKFLDFLEDFLRNLQLGYMKKKKTTEVTTKDLIHFNKHDHTADILEQYRQEAAKIS
jgi:predicted nucleotidyltransferase